VVLGVLAVTTGSVEIDGIDISKHRARALARTNFAAVYAALPGNLTVSENLRFFGLLYGIESLRIRVVGLLREFDLAHLRHTKCGRQAAIRYMQWRRVVFDVFIACARRVQRKQPGRGNPRVGKIAHVDFRRRRGAVYRRKTRGRDPYR
jgi:ABC-type transport system involved in cytochrome c biogenesis ATPase subunit